MYVCANRWVKIRSYSRGKFQSKDISNCFKEDNLRKCDDAGWSKWIDPDLYKQTKR